jgi:hypothetical protein
MAFVTYVTFVASVPALGVPLIVNDVTEGVALKAGDAPEPEPTRTVPVAAVPISAMVIPSEWLNKILINAKCLMMGAKQVIMVDLIVIH